MPHLYWGGPGKTIDKRRAARERGRPLRQPGGSESVATMPRILIANVDNECMLPDRWELTDEFCLASSIAAERLAWFAEPGDIVVLQRNPSKRLRDHIARTMGYAPGAVTY
ncbi:MAG: hypothetical protein ACREEP_14530, partial [Dongiaceae bacterium]